MKAKLRIEHVAFPPDAATGAAWDRLAQAAGTPNLFYERWAVAAAQALPEAAGLSLLLAWEEAAAGPRLAGLLPLQPRRMMRGLLSIAVQNWDQRVRALGEPLIRAGCETAFWDAVLPALDRQRGLGHHLRLSALAADSPSTRALLAVVAARGRPALVTRSIARAQLLAGPSSADYIAANIRKKVLKEQKRLRARLNEQGSLRFEALAADAPAAPWIDDLFRLELTGWKGREGVAAAADPRTETCFRALLTAAHAAGRLDFRRLLAGETVLAMLATILAGDRAFQLKIAHDEAYAAFSPGVLLEMHYLETMLDTGTLAQVDSCARPGHPMIERIWVDRLAIVSLAIPFDRPFARLLCRVQAHIRRRYLKPPRLNTEA